tara:strand:+ start:1276 stop:1737 length:462 start_codon:yes stop_codon:yes gene_type:complete
MYLAEFATFWRQEMNTLDCPTYPKKPQDLPLSARMCLENYNNGELYQNMFGKPESLPADVLVRYNAGQSIPQDESKLFEAGLTQAATAARVRGEELDTKIMQNTVEEGRKRYLEEIKRSEQFSNASFGERLAMSGALSPEQIARNKQAYGITE